MLQKDEFLPKGLDYFRSLYYDKMKEKFTSQEGVIKMAKFTKIGVLTSGGDAPGMNAAIRAVTFAAQQMGVEVVGIYEGYKGLIHPNFKTLTDADVSNTISMGGTILYSDRCLEFKTQEGIDAAKKTCIENGIQGVICIGGDGTFRGATDFTNNGIPCIGIPGTIDNDITSTDYSIGFDTAMNTVVDMVDRLRDTCDSHRRCNVVEVMGRAAGDIALQSGIASGATAIALKEIPFDEDAAVAKLIRGKEEGKRNFIVIVSEGIPLESAKDPQYSEKLAQRLQEKTGIETKFARLAHVVRGGKPTLRDRLLAAEMGAYAVDLLFEGKSNRVVCTQNDKIVDLDIGYALALDKLYKEHIDPNYAKKLTEEQKAKFTKEQLAEMQEFCRKKFEAYCALYDVANRVSN